MNLDMKAYREVIMKTCDCCDSSLPIDWKVKSLLDISKTKPMYGINAAASDLREGAPRYLRITDIDLDGKLLDTDPKGVDANDVDDFLLTDGDIVFARTGNTTGKSFHYVGSYGPLVFAGFLIKFNINEDIADSKFIYYCTQTHSYKNWVSVMSQRSGQPGINSKEYSGLTVPLPPLPEQKKIAKILSKVDEYINEADSMIADLAILKKGMMQKLLTKGIGNENFIDSSIGPIPIGWEVKNIDQLCTTTSGGTPKKGVAEYYDNGTIPWVKTGELKQKYVNNIEDSITELALEKSSAKLVKKGTVLLAMYGATIGRVSILGLDASTNQAVCCIICDESKLVNEYLYYHLLLNRDMLVQSGAGAAQPNISQTIVKKYTLAVPTIDEQVKIVTMLNSIDQMIETYEGERRDFSELKRGFMQQLLTGKVRVGVNE